jgi:hypothetical protein
MCFIGVQCDAKEDEPKSAADEKSADAEISSALIGWSIEKSDT